MDRVKSRGGWFGPPPSGNRAFDEYRSEILKRLEEEGREFKDFLARLGFAKDRAEFKPTGEVVPLGRIRRPSRRRPNRAADAGRAPRPSSPKRPPPPGQGDLHFVHLLMAYAEARLSNHPRAAQIDQRSPPSQISM
jgi:hypothetical protein